MPFDKVRGGGGSRPRSGHVRLGGLRGRAGRRDRFRQDDGVLTISYCRLGPETAGEVLTLQRAAFLSEARTYGRVDIPPLAETLVDIRREIAETLTVGAYLGARLVGAARLGVESEIGWISRVAVAPDLQGEGIGSGLLEALEEMAPGEVTRFQLGAGGKSAANIALYERRGYRELSRTLDVVGIELVIMAKDR
jgi:GNAT superfamily N-acetyltransferase